MLIQKLQNRKPPWPTHLHLRGHVQLDHLQPARAQRLQHAGLVVILQLLEPGKHLEAEIVEPLGQGTGQGRLAAGDEDALAQRGNLRED